MTVRGTLGLQTGSRCMETTIRSVISSPSTSGNDPRLAHIWMYVSWDIYRDTYLDIWVRRVIIIIDASYDSRYVYPLCYRLWIHVSLLWFLVYLLWYQLWFLLGWLLWLPLYTPVLSIPCSCFFWIHVVLVMHSRFELSYDLQLWFYTLGFLWHETKVYIWGFPCLDYSFDVLVSWDRDLSIYNHFCL